MPHALQIDVCFKFLYVSVHVCVSRYNNNDTSNGSSTRCNSSFLSSEFQHGLVYVWVTKCMVYDGIEWCLICEYC